MKHIKLHDYFTKMIRNTIRSIKYLPQNQLNLLLYVKKKWNISDFSYFIVNSLIMPQFKLYFGSTVLSCTDSASVSVVNLTKYVDDMFEHDGYKIELTNDLYSCLEMPNVFFRQGSVFSFTYVLTTFDIDLLLGLNLRYPPYIKPLRAKPILPTFQPYIFSYSYVPIHKINRDGDNDLFSSISFKSKSSLNDLINTQYKYNQLNIWKIRSSSFLSQLSICFSKVFHMKSLEDNINIDQIPRISNLSFWSAVGCLGYFEPEIMKRFESIITLLEKSLVSFLNHRKTIYNSHPLWSQPFINQKICDVSGYLCLATISSSFFARCVILFEFIIGINSVSLIFNDLQKENSIESLIEFCFIVNDPIWVFRTTIFLQAAAFTDDRFMAICPRPMFEMWAVFAPHFLSFINK